MLSGIVVLNSMYLFHIVSFWKICIDASILMKWRLSFIVRRFNFNGFHWVMSMISTWFWHFLNWTSKLIFSLNYTIYETESFIHKIYKSLFHQHLISDTKIRHHKTVEQRSMVCCAAYGHSPNQAFPTYSLDFYSNDLKTCLLYEMEK